MNETALPSETESGEITPLEEACQLDDQDVAVQDDFSAGDVDLDRHRVSPPEAVRVRSVGSVDRSPAASVLRSVQLMDSVRRSVAATTMPSVQLMDSVRRSVAATTMPSVQFMDSVRRSVAATTMPSVQLMDSVRRSVAATTMPSVQLMDSVHWNAAAMAMRNVQLMNSAIWNPATSMLSRFQSSVEIGLTSLRVPAIFRVRARFKETGWFPHSTFPRHLLESETVGSHFDEAVLRYYRVNWEQVKEAIEAELSQCLVSEDAKAAVHQALIAHEQELYRLVPPALFTAIEGAVRVGLFKNKVGPLSVEGQLLSSLGKLPISSLPDGVWGLAGISNLRDHLYEQVRDETARKKFSGAAVPNRHAAIHALVNYSSEKSSLNAIFAAVFVFRSLSALQITP